MYVHFDSALSRHLGVGAVTVPFPTHLILCTTPRVSWGSVGSLAFKRICLKTISRELLVYLSCDVVLDLM